MTELNNLLENIQNIKINIGNAIENKGQTVTNFASYPNAILNIKAAEGDILLFSNLSEMNNYTNMNEGDLALVYDINTSNLQALWQYMNNSWGLAPTGLTANKEYVNSAKFWGANGVETGVLQVNNNLTTEQVKIKAQIYNDLSYLELDPSLTNLSGAFRSFNITSLPNFNTSNVTDMSYTFASCTNLVNVPEFNTSKVTDMRGMFNGCINLSDASIADITNSLPLAANLTNQYVTNIGLNLERFDDDQLRILNTKGYIDVIAPEEGVPQNYYNISWDGEEYNWRF